MTNSVSETADSIVVTIDVDMPIEAAWRYWTQPTDLSKWLCEKANVQLHVGGPFELFWEPEHPERNSTIGCVISALELHKSLDFNWKGPVPYADLMNVEPLPTSVTVTFDSIDHNNTRISLQHRGWSQGQRWLEARKWQENAWAIAFAELKKMPA